MMIRNGAWEWSGPGVWLAIERLDITVCSHVPTELVSGKEAGGVRRCQDGVLECRFTADMGCLGRRLKTQGLECPGGRSQSRKVGALVLRTLGSGAVVRSVQV